MYFNPINNTYFDSKEASDAFDEKMSEEYAEEALDCESYAYVIYDPIDNTFNKTSIGFDNYDKDIRKAIMYPTYESAKKSWYYNKDRHGILKIKISIEAIVLGESNE